MIHAELFPPLEAVYFMTLVFLRSSDESPADDSNIDLKVEFDSSLKDGVNSSFESSTGLIPTRISAAADGLVECDAASTCPSDSDSVLLFESSMPQACFVAGSSVIFRNLRPSVTSAQIENAVLSLGIPVTANCPSFTVVDPQDSSDTQEFNFGFATVALSSPEEAILVNFMLHSFGTDELLCSTPLSSIVDEEDGDFPDSVGLDQVSLEMAPWTFLRNQA